MLKILQKSTYVAFFLIFLYGNALAISRPDSVAIKTVDGKKYISHTVAAKETWYSIARAYKISYADLRKTNSSASDALKIGEKVLIPSSSEMIKVKQDAPAEREAIYHVVKKKETLFSIAKLYNINADSIKKWNHLKSNKVKNKQSLIVGYKIIPVKEVAKADVETEKAATEKTPTVVPVKPSSKTEKAKMKRAIKEQGVGSWIRDDQVTANKYYALHRTAPIGTIIKVTNRMNKQYVLVKVVGELPDTGDNYDLIIKVTKSSAEKLGIRDQRFQCELDYSVAE